MIALRFAAINALPLRGRPLASFSKRGLITTCLPFTRTIILRLAFARLDTANLPDADFFELA